MTESTKRKEAPSGSAGAQHDKKKKTGNSGKWRTPHHQAKASLPNDSGFQPGDTGIWVTCARHQEARAAREVSMLFAEYAEKLYGIKEKDFVGSEDEDSQDIEAAIQKEIAALNSKGEYDSAAIFTPMKMGVDCLVFFKTRAPIEPVEFVRRICVDAKACADPRQLRCRYVNRLTPSTVMGKATEQGIVELAKKALAPFFDLGGKRATRAEPRTESAADAVSEQKQEGDSGRALAGAADAITDGPSESIEVPASEGEAANQQQKEADQAFTFAIRPTVRNHSKLKRDFVINEIAGLINDDRHKVNLKAPDKVILVDLYQSTCGISVVDGDWDDLKRYNLTELYSQAVKNNG
ncbi:hypothetical protein B0T26DRAFT_718592 [Lasiosphaeria miniovina]|uniref:THUMP domain-containing protein n=1 Tax=Lasiosphaeria miniovina TaxID=1954250 RepID=A0AA40ADG3_9PEZI|nr:uncharacterized protein B0T26DRAFT_718592 [Lasiosphaeria miniovina]KAK0713831.1 hypothetical protein B0T26DRAFT_718592 [Lasiosphaeria miniovina]